jgi:hypothetical protein
MKCCDCCSEEEAVTSSVCPECGHPGQTVPDETLQALLTLEAQERLLPGAYCFCETPDCPTVYYSTESASRFAKDDVTVRVGGKEKSPPRPLCYCFGHTYESVREEWERTGQVASLEQIEAATRGGTCHCRTANPRGACCLPQVRRFVAELKGEES